MIIARTDARAMLSLDEAIWRGNAALEAGADMVFVEATQTLEEVAAVPKAVKGPCLLNVVPGGRTPIFDLREAEAMGYKLAILPGLMLVAAIQAGDAALAQLKATHKAPEVTQSVAQTFRRFGADEWDALRQRFNAGAAMEEQVMAGRTLFDKIWDAHVIRDLGDGWALLHIDRHLLHDLSGPARARRGDGARPAGARPRTGVRHARPCDVEPARPQRPDLRARRQAVDRAARPHPVGRRAPVRSGPARAGHRACDGARSWASCCPASPWSAATATPAPTAALGAMAFGIGSSESTHALATQTLRQQKPRRMRIRCDGALRAGVTAKDLALHIIGKLGAAAGVGYAIEYAGSADRGAWRSRRRLTLCNLTVELGARCGMVAPDQRTFDYLRGQPFAPQGEAFDAAVAQWRAAGQRRRCASSIARKSIDVSARSARPSPGAPAPSTRSPSTAACPIRKPSPMPRSATRWPPRSTTWA